jgi:hypothetical protein
LDRFLSHNRVDHIAVETKRSAFLTTGRFFARGCKPHSAGQSPPLVERCNRVMTHLTSGYRAQSECRRRRQKKYSTIIYPLWFYDDCYYCRFIIVACRRLALLDFLYLTCSSSLPRLCLLTAASYFLPFRFVFSLYLF